MTIYDSQTQSKSTKNSRSFRDLDLDFTRNAVTNDVNVVEDVIAVKRSVRNLIQTNFYERPFNPTFGSDARALLFEPVDSITIQNMRRVIETAIKNHEPRVNVIKIAIGDLVDANAYNIGITYELLDVNTNNEVNLVLERLR